MIKYWLRACMNGEAYFNTATRSLAVLLDEGHRLAGELVGGVRDRADRLRAPQHRVLTPRAGGQIRMRAAEEAIERVEAPRGLRLSLGAYGAATSTSRAPSTSV